MDKFERFDKFEKLDRKVEETIREVETMDRRKFYRNSFVCAGVWALLLNLVIETLGRFPTVGIFGGLSFMVHSPLVFLYNALILYATLVLASLFKRRVFFFTIVSIFWLGIGIINGTKNMEEALRFVEWFGSAQIQGEWAEKFGTMPANEIAAEKADPFQRELCSIPAQNIDWALVAKNIDAWCEKITLEYLP